MITMMKSPRNVCTTKKIKHYLLIFLTGRFERSDIINLYSFMRINN